VRTILLSMSFCICVSSLGLAAPIESENLALGRTDDKAQRLEDSWRGREHFLYDNEFTAKTDGAAMAGQNACARKLARVMGQDGKTAIVRVNKCD
jgi:hypothetical protein